MFRHSSAARHLMLLTVTVASNAATLPPFTLLDCTTAAPYCLGHLSYELPFAPSSVAVELRTGVPPFDLDYVTATATGQQTFQVDSLSPSVGRLLQVEVVLTGQTSSDYEVTNPTSISLFGDTGSQISVTFLGATSTDGGPGGSGDIFLPGTQGVRTTTSFSIFQTGDPVSFTGSGTTAVPVSYEFHSFAGYDPNSPVSVVHVATPSPARTNPLVLEVNYQYLPVPEPASLALSAIGLGVWVAGGYTRRRVLGRRTPL
jgi:hypothetical protein